MDAVDFGRPDPRAARPRAGAARERDCDAGRARKRIGLRHDRSTSSSCGTGASARRGRSPSSGRCTRPRPRHPPPSLVVPAGLDRSLAGGGAALVVPSAGRRAVRSRRDDHPAHRQRRPGQQLRRRARQTIRDATGSRSRVSSLDFGDDRVHRTCDLGEGQELIAPQRLSAWSDNPPVVVSTGDPRPPVVPVEHVTARQPAGRDRLESRPHPLGRAIERGRLLHLRGHRGEHRSTPAACRRRPVRHARCSASRC